MMLTVHYSWQPIQHQRSNGTFLADVFHSSRPAPFHPSYSGIANNTDSQKEDKDTTSFHTQPRKVYNLYATDKILRQNQYRPSESAFHKPCTSIYSLFHPSYSDIANNTDCRSANRDMPSSHTRPHKVYNPYATDKIRHQNRYHLCEFDFHKPCTSTCPIVIVPHSPNPPTPKPRHFAPNQVQSQQATTYVSFLIPLLLLLLTTIP